MFGHGEILEILRALAEILIVFGAYADVMVILIWLAAPGIRS